MTRFGEGEPVCSPLHVPMARRRGHGTPCPYKNVAKLGEGEARYRTIMRAGDLAGRPYENVANFVSMRRE